jgi:aminopeptidase N
MASKIVNPSFPAINHDLRFFLQHYPVAYDVDRTAGANPIRQDLANLSEAGSLYGAIIYQKAPVVMRQLERLIGEADLREGLREYLTLHGFSNAGWPELVAMLDRRTPIDLAAWSRSWVNERGRRSRRSSRPPADGWRGSPFGSPTLAGAASPGPNRCASRSGVARPCRWLTSRSTNQRWTCQA